MTRQTAVRLIHVKAVRRLPAVNDEGRLLGLVSFDDLLGVLDEDLQELWETSGLEQSREARQRGVEAVAARPPPSADGAPQRAIA